MKPDNKNTDKWLKSLRNRMEGYTEPVSGDMWSKLENDLKKEHPAHIIPIRRWITATAAIAAVLIVGYIISIRLTEPDIISILAEHPTKDEVALPEFTEIVPIKKEEQITGIRPTIASTQQLKPIAKTIQPQQTQVSVTLESVAPEKNKEKKETSAPAQQDTNKRSDESQQVSVHNYTKPKVSNTSGNMYSTSPIHSNKNSKGWSLGISVNNGLLAHQANNQPSLNYISEMKNPTNDTQLPAYDSEFIYRSLSNDNGFMQLKHHNPITFGLNARFNLTNRLAIESGLTYTLLSSDCKYNDAGVFVKKEQKLHYIGIPVKLSYTIWNYSRFSAYSSAGVAIEKCVSAEMETSGKINGKKQPTKTENLDADNPQFSVSAAVGAQINLLRQCGLYIEPGIIYHFDDGNPIETIRKEHPFNFNMEIGVRLNF